MPFPRVLCFTLAMAFTAGSASAAEPAGADPAPSSVAMSPIATPDPATLDLGVSFGGGARLGDSQFYDITARGGAAFGAFVWMAPSPSFAFGLMYQHLGLGHEQAGIGPFGTVDIDRGAHLGWLGLRLFPIHRVHGSLYIEIAPGLAFQHASASGLLGSGGDPTVAPQPYTCKASSAAALGLRAGIGGDVDLGEHFYASLGATFDNLRFSSDAMDDCVNGSGTVTELLATLSFSYRIDVTHIVR